MTDVKTEKGIGSETKPPGAGANDFGKQQEQKDENTSNQSKSKRDTNSYSQGYEYKGENDGVGVILALRTERFNHKVVFSSFSDKLRNYVVSNFKDAKDIVPMIEELRDTTAEVYGEEPGNLTGQDALNAVKVIIKTEQVKRWMRRIENLKNNKATLYGLVWGQCSAGLQESIKGELEFEEQSKLFNCIWLLEKAKLISSGVDEKANKYYTLLKSLMAMCNIRQGQNESNDSYRKRVESAVLTVNLIGGDDMLYSRNISTAVDPDDPEESKVKYELQKMKAMLMILRSDPVRYGNLQDSLLEGMHKGRDEFPKTVVDAYDLLQRISIDIYQQHQGKTSRFKNPFSRKNN